MKKKHLGEGVGCFPKSIPNFEVFRWNISSITNLLFLKSYTYVQLLLHILLLSLQQSKALAKVSSSSAILNKQGQGTKISQHSSSMSNLRKASISGPTNASVPTNAPSGGSNSNFYLAKSEYG